MYINTFGYDTVATCLKTIFLFDIVMIMWLNNIDPSTRNVNCSCPAFNSIEYKEYNKSLNLLVWVRAIDNDEHKRNSRKDVRHSMCYKLHQQQKSWGNSVITGDTHNPVVED